MRMWDKWKMEANPGYTIDQVTSLRQVIKEIKQIRNFKINEILTVSVPGVQSLSPFISYQNSQ